MTDTPQNPRKFHLHEGEARGFDDNNQPIAVTWPDHACSAEEIALGHLEDLGARFPDRAAALKAIASYLDIYGDQRAAESLSMWFANLPGGRRGDELRAAFLGSVDGESLAQTAKRHGVCKVTWFRAVTRLRTRICGKTANGIAIGGDMNPEQKD